MALTLIIGLITQANLGAAAKKKKQPEASKDLVVNGELTNQDDKDRVRTNSYCKTFTFKMTKGQTYQIDMKSKDIDSYLRLENPAGDEVAKDDDGGGFPDARIIYTPEETGDFKIIATTFGGNSTGKFTLTARDTVIALKNDKGMATYTGSIEGKDALYKGKKHKAFTFPMEAGKTYQIDHMSTKFDCYLYLIGPDGKVLAEDDDGGEGLNSRIEFKAEKAGTYRIIATSLGGSGTGDFTFSVREKE